MSALSPTHSSTNEIKASCRIVGYSYKWNCLFNARSVSIRFLTFGVVTPVLKDSRIPLRTLESICFNALCSGSGVHLLPDVMSANAKGSEKPFVCVVDDDSLIRDSTVRLIRSFGFRVEAFASAEEFENSDYLEETACLILDVRMPGRNGLELQHRLSEAGHRIPIIFITAHADDEQERRAMEAGASRFLYKPFSQESLLQAVRSALGEPQPET